MIDRKTNIVRSIDWVTVVIYMVLVLMGWFNIYAAVYNEEHKSIFDFSQRYGLQMLWILAAFLIALSVVLIDLKFYTFFAYFIYAFCIFLLVLVLLIGREINGNKAFVLEAAAGAWSSITRCFLCCKRAFISPAVGFAWSTEYSGCPS